MPDQQKDYISIITDLRIKNSNQQIHQNKSKTGCQKFHHQQAHHYKYAIKLAVGSNLFCQICVEQFLPIKA
jgi:hypothetical protein